MTFEQLQNILDMDFKKMRALAGPGGMRATDDAILLFVKNLAEFYSQFKRPTVAEFKTYKVYMDKITEKINKAEYAYYLGKYTVEDPQNAAVLASHCQLNSFKDIPKRMQYWASSETFGGTIRNAQLHIVVVKNLEKWAKYVPSTAGFFKPSNESDEKQQPSNVKSPK